MNEQCKQQRQMNVKIRMAAQTTSLQTDREVGCAG